MAVEEGGDVDVLDGAPARRAAVAVAGDAVGPLRVDGRVDAAGGGDVEGGGARVEQTLGVGGLPRAGAAEDERAGDQATVVPRATRGAGMRSFRICVARVNAYHPNDRALISSPGNRARTLPTT